MGLLLWVACRLGLHALKHEMTAIRRLLRSLIGSTSRGWGL